MLYEEILSLSDGDALKKWVELASNCGQTQKEVLMSILDYAKDTEYGKKYDFVNIKSIEDFQNRIPFNEYEDIDEYVERMADGEEDVLFPGITEFFISTSGTTGKSKKIPESHESSLAKKAVLKLRNAFLGKTILENIEDSKKFIKLVRDKRIDMTNGNVSSLIGHVHYYSVTSAIPNKKTKGGIDVGFASGKTFETSEFTNYLSYPKELMGLSDGEATMYLTMLFSLRYDDVVLVTSNNAGRFYARVKYAQEHAEEIINDLRNGTISERLNISSDERELFENYIEPHVERAEELEELLNKGREYFIPKYYWPYQFIARFWLSGSVGVNVDKVRPYLDDDVFYFDIGYGASEGKLNIPMSNEMTYGTLATSSIFFEFIPVGSDEILTADELEDGGEYELILTNYAGLYRYPLHDIVKVKGFFGNTPNIEFLSKSREILNIAQEKLPASQVLDNLNEFLTENDYPLRQAQIYPNNELLHYDIFIELEDSQINDIDLNELSVDFDNLLREDAELYDRNRKFKSLNQLELYLMKEGWQSHLYDLREETGAPRSQIKLDAVIKEKPEEEWLR